MKLDLKIIQDNLLEQYCDQVDKELPNNFDRLVDAEISTDIFSFYTSVASVFSSKIEGENIELDSYIKHKKMGIKFPSFLALELRYSFSKLIFLFQSNIGFLIGIVSYRKNLHIE